MKPRFATLENFTFATLAFLGTEQAVKMYLDDILNFCLRIFSSSSNWNIKAQTLQTLSSIAEKYCSSMNDEKLSKNIFSLWMNNFLTLRRFFV